MIKSKKNRRLFASSVGVLAATSVVAPLSTMTSCANATNKIEFIADKEYGVTETTYTDLREEFKTQYKAQLELIFPESSDEVTRRITYLEKQLTSLDEIKNQKTHGFTTLTSSMMNFSKDGVDFDGKKYSEYNLHLSRKTNAQWSQLDTIFNSWKGAFKQYMLNSDLPLSTITKVMQDAQNKFINLKNNLMETCNDALDGVIKGKELLITCFDEVNDEIAFLSATLQLKEFKDQYVFDPKTTDGALLDNITNENSIYYRPDFKVGNILSDETMQQLFTITKKDDNVEIPFTKTLIKGHTILPKLTKITVNKYSNLNTFKIDFGLVKTSYIGKYDKEKLASVTAHCYSADNWDFSDFNDDTTLSQMIQKLEILSTEYPIYLTKDGEHKVLKDVYFNQDSEKGHISFKWDDKNADNQAYEAFFDNATYDEKTKTWTSHLSSNSLINSCLMISDGTFSHKFIKDILSSNEEIVVDNFAEARPKNLAELFLSTCEVSADVTIDETDTNHKVVTINNFYVNYANSIYEDQEKGKLALENTTDYAQFQTECINHQVSKTLFEKVNEKFNDIVSFVTVYDNTIVNSSKNKNEEITEAGLEELRKDTEIQFLIASASILAGVIAASMVAVSIWAPWNLDSKNKAGKVVTAVLLIVSLIVQCALFTAWLAKYYIPTNDYIKKYKNFKDESPKTDLVHDLTAGLDKYSLIKEDGSYNKKDFNDKKEAFSHLSMPQMLQEYRNYSCIETSDTSNLHSSWIEYQELLKSKNVEPEELREKISGWDRGGKYWVIQLSTSIGIGAISICLNCWIRKAQMTKRDIIWDEYLPGEHTIVLPGQEDKFMNESGVAGYEEELISENKKNIENLLPSIRERLSDLAKQHVKMMKRVGRTPEISMNSVIDIFAALVWEINDQIWTDDKTIKEMTAKEQDSKVPVRAALLRTEINDLMGSYTPTSTNEWDVELFSNIFSDLV